MGLWELGPVELVEAAAPVLSGGCDFWMPLRRAEASELEREQRELEVEVAGAEGVFSLLRMRERLGWNEKLAPKQLITNVQASHFGPRTAWPNRLWTGVHIGQNAFGYRLLPIFQQHCSVKTALRTDAD
ncbi:hypothetical protein AK812_SmicGene34135 [Symbiodinium microadriaticum]|uniref:Uncharacterized protein n=1 Tax=Symbiodinium microadriaticum TaxID=2951 RepID=A0A1Q9CPU2_SYMMI|nr:hypothetical protein AK812_SmicGene34135 [Symbiodinium microadriaticum]